MLMGHNGNLKNTQQREAEEKQKVALSFENTDKLDKPLPEMIKKKMAHINHFTIIRNG